MSKLNHLLGLKGEICKLTLFFITLNVYFLTPGQCEPNDWKKDFETAPIPSPYSKLLDQLLEHWKPSLWTRIPGNPPKNGKVSLTCYSDKKSRAAGSVIQHMIVSAPPESVQQVIDDFSAYTQLFQGFTEVKILEKRGPTWLVLWEPSLPFPLPKIQYRMIYHVGSVGNAHFYRYQLSSGDSLKYSDGIIILEAIPGAPKKTHYLEMDFWNPNFGIAEFVAPTRILRESVDGLYISDRAFQLKAESIKEPANEIEKQAKAELDTGEVERCIHSNVEFKPFW